MPILRGVLLGLLLGTAIASLTFFNDEVLRLTPLASSTLAAAVFGLLLILIFAVNPALGSMRRCLRFSRAELGTAVAIALAACAWPGDGFFAYFTHLMAGPAMQYHTKPYWKNTQPFAYMSGGSPDLAAGYVRNWDVLAEGIATPGGPMEQWAAKLSPRVREAAQRLHQSASSDIGRDRRLVRDGITDLFDDPTLAGVEASTPHEQRIAGRQALERALPEAIRPMPKGTDMILSGGRESDAVVGLAPSASSTQVIGPADLPWQDWWPPVRLWGGLALLMATATFGLMLLFYPQWADREQLSFPIARFVDELTASETAGRRLPRVAYSKAFWAATAAMVLLHTINGLAAWFPALPTIPLQFELRALGDLMPAAAKQYGFSHFFAPTLVPTVIAFAFFVDSKVSFSVGISALLWIGLGTVLATQGMNLSNNRYDVGPIGPALRFGAYLGMGGVILFLARHHLISVTRRALHLGHMGVDRGTKDGASIGLWLAVVGATAATVWLVLWSSVSAVMAILIIAMVLLMFVVLARINAETGLFAIGPEWIPWVMLAGLIGPAAMGMESLIVLIFAGLVLAANPRVALAPLLINALRIGERVGSVPPRRLSKWLGLMVIASFVVAMVLTLTIQYNTSLDRSASDFRVMPGVSIGSFTRVLFEQDAVGALPTVTRLHGLDHLKHIDPDLTVVTWTSLGLVLVVMCWSARLRLPWWPLHPVVLLVWGIYLASFLAASFLLAWLFKSRLIAYGGQRAYEAVRPFMIGLIAGELAMVVVWGVVSLVYRLSTGVPPEAYRVIPI